MLIGSLLSIVSMSEIMFILHIFIVYIFGRYMAEESCGPVYFG